MDTAGKGGVKAVGAVIGEFRRWAGEQGLRGNVAGGGEEGARWV